MAESAPDVVCRGLSKRFSGESSQASLTVFEALDCRFMAGQTTAIVGTSGCGKSTLLRLLAGLETPSSGSVRIGTDTPLELRSRAALAVGFQDPSLLPWRTVRRNIELALQLARRRTDRVAVDAVISMVGLEGFGDVRPAALSGGMRQRAALARCLITEPALLLLDEPFGALDEITRSRLTAELPQLWRNRGTTTIFVTHSISEAVQIADRVLVLTPRPAVIAADISIALPADRDANMEYSPLFQGYVERVRQALSSGGVVARGGIAPPLHASC